MVERGQGISLDELKKYSSRCSSNYNLLLRKSKELYTSGIDPLMKKLDNAREEGFIQNDEYKKIFNDYKSTKKEFLENNDRIKKYTKDLENNLSKLKGKASREDIDKTNKAYGSLLKTTGKTVENFKKIASFYIGMTENLGLDKSSALKSVRDYDSILSNFIPDSMKRKDTSPQKARKAA